MGEHNMLNGDSCSCVNIPDFIPRYLLTKYERLGRHFVLKRQKNWNSCVEINNYRKINHIFGIFSETTTRIL